MSHFNKLPAELQFEILTLAVRTSGMHGYARYDYPRMNMYLQNLADGDVEVLNTVLSLHHVCRAWRMLANDVLYDYIVYLNQRESGDNALLRSLEERAGKAGIRLRNHLVTNARLVNVPGHLQNPIARDILQLLWGGSGGEFQMCFFGAPSLTMQYMRLTSMDLKFFVILRNVQSVGQLMRRFYDLGNCSNFAQRRKGDPRAAELAESLPDQRAVELHAQDIATRDYGSAQPNDSQDSMEVLYYYWQRGRDSILSFGDPPTLRNQHYDEREKRLFSQAFQELMAKECLTIFDHPDIDDSEWMRRPNLGPSNGWPKKTRIQWPSLG